MRPLVPLLSGTFRRADFTLEWLQKKYSGEFAGVEGFSCVALTEGGEAAACLGILPWPIRSGDRVEIAAQLVDGATHHHHRRRGLFTQLGEMAREVCDAAGQSFLFGFAHPQGTSFPALVGNLGYTHLDSLDLIEYLMPIHTLWMERVARRARPLGRLYEQLLDRGLSAYLPGNSVLENSFLAEGFAGTYRDRLFFDYKMLLGNRVLALDGGRVWVKIRRGLIVGDMEGMTETEMEKTLRVLHRMANRFGIHQIVCQSSKGTRFSSFFGGRLPPRQGLNVVYRNLRSQIRPETLRFTLADLDNF
jgi:hypothetical protein